MRQRSLIGPAGATGDAPSRGDTAAIAPWSPRKGAVVAAIGLGVLAFAVLDRSGIAAFALGQPRSIPTMFGAALLLIAAVVAWELGKGARASGEPVYEGWTLVSALLSLLALEQSTSLYRWATEWTDLPREALLMVTAAVVLAVLVLGSLRLYSTRGFIPWILGAATWLLAFLVELVADDRAQPAAAAALELGALALMTLALLLALPPARLPWKGSIGRGTPREIAERSVEAVSVSVATRFLLAAIAVFGLLGGLLIVLDQGFLGSVQNASNPLQWFDLNQELSFPAYFSGLLLLAMAALALLVSRLPSVRLGSPTPWVLMAMVVGFLAVDEVVDFHGRAQGSTGVEAQILLAPLILLAAVVGVVLLRRLWSVRPVRDMFLGGGVAWGMAMAIDPETHPGSTLAFPEEMLEMIGSALFLLALLWLARSGLGIGQAEAREPTPTATATR